MFPSSWQWWLEGRGVPGAPRHLVPPFESPTPPPFPPSGPRACVCAFICACLRMQKFVHYTYVMHKSPTCLSDPLSMEQSLLCDCSRPAPLLPPLLSRPSRSLCSFPSVEVGKAGLRKLSAEIHAEAGWGWGVIWASWCGFDGMCSLAGACHGHHR